jgi:hypothetical protein
MTRGLTQNVSVKQVQKRRRGSSYASLFSFFPFVLLHLPVNGGIVGQSPTTAFSSGNPQKLIRFQLFSASHGLFSE